jgi:hypothetical protein
LSALGAKSREPREKLEDVKLKRVWAHLAELNRAAVAQAPEQTAQKKISKKESTWIDLTHKTGSASSTRRGDRQKNQLGTQEQLERKSEQCKQSNRHQMQIKPKSKRGKQPTRVTKIGFFY